ncbi:MAG: riboflavin biosynthesis protein RibF [Defluviitaleaceae bacterium]|nr:riboflavin biosynthesis protein RibF [Defluviitaleaceae bacterium]
MVVLAIGKFESIHRGHRALLGETVRRAKESGLASAVMVFEPHPFTVLGHSDYKPLFTQAERLYLFEECELEHVFTCPFDAEFAALSPAAFCKKLFCEYDAREIIVGEDYRFGQNREGTVETLRNEAAKYGAGVFVFRVMEANGQGISTSLIRKLLAGNRLPEAAQLLGFPFFAIGTTEKGRQLGRTLGFPTLNFYPDDKKFLPADGVYATRTFIRGVGLDSITNIGLRPTVSEPTGLAKKRSVETHILNMPLDFDLYGEFIKVEFLQFIRTERHFDSLDVLKNQIQEDILQILRNFSS